MQFVHSARGNGITADRQSFDINTDKRTHASLSSEKGRYYTNHTLRVSRHIPSGGPKGDIIKSVPKSALAHET